MGLVLRVHWAGAQARVLLQALRVRWVLLWAHSTRQAVGGSM
ncbi:MAG: hypothetical protein RLZ89_1118, partial [Pseudomonadota bacterium]